MTTRLPNSLSPTLVAFVCGAACVLTATSALAIDKSVPRSQRGLPETAALSGGQLIGLRGGPLAPNPALQTRVGIWEGDFDRRQAAGDVSGFTTTHPALQGQWAGPNATRNFAEQPGVPDHPHSMWVTGVVLSKDATHRGMAPRAVGFGAGFDDIQRVDPYPRMNVAADHSTFKAAGDFLADSGSRVINLSFGYKKTRDGDGTRNLTAADLDGSSYPTKLFDSYAFTGRVMVKSAGNSETIVSVPGDNFNGITVGALGSVRDVNHDTVVRVGQSSNYLPLAHGRNGVHIVAPGDTIYSTNLGTGFTDSGFGTSYAAPHVSGAAAILASAMEQASRVGATSDNGRLFDYDHRLIKAILLNSARKIPGAREGEQNPDTVWKPGLVGGDDGRGPRWTHPLNYVVGAGELDVNAAWLQLKEESRSVGGAMERRLWHTAFFTAVDDPREYKSNQFDGFTVPGGHWITDFTATLCWDRHVTDAALAAPTLSNLDLELAYSVDGGTTWTNILRSMSPNDSTEHLYLTGLARPGENPIYRLMVVARSLGTDSAGAAINQEHYALAFSFRTIPTPGSLLLAALGGLLAARRSRRA